MALLALLLALLVLPRPAAASDWGGIQPGVTIREHVHERYGPPSKENRIKVEGYETIQWIYEGSRAPAGIAKMTLDFGLLTPTGFQGNLVRLLTLEPKPLIFGRGTVIQGWGLPDGLGNNPDGTITLLWKDGLFVTLDQEGQNAAIMVFAPPQPDLPIQNPGPAGSPPSAPNAPPRAAPSAPPSAAPAPKR